MAKISSAPECKVVVGLAIGLRWEALVALSIARSLVVWCSRASAARWGGGREGGQI